MSDFVIYHNPMWGKSRGAVSLLKEKGIEPVVVEYLKTPLNKSQLQDLSLKLNLHPREFVRKGESDFQSNNLSAILDDDQALLEAMSKYPKIMERPIIVSGNKAVLGRPPENVLTLLGE